MQPQRLLSALLVLSLAAVSGCKQEPKPEPAPRVKRVIRLTPMETKYIELDDGSVYGMGENLYNALVRELQNSDHFVVVVEENWDKVGIKSLRSASVLGNPVKPDPSDRLHFEFAPIPAADFRGEIGALGFTHGSRGVKRYAGFSPEFHTDWNKGDFQTRNEFPPRSTEIAPSWFGQAFDPIGTSTNNTITGVTAGEEGELNLIIASIHYRRDRFKAETRVGTSLRYLAEAQDRQTNFDTTGTGYLFAFGASFLGMSAEFTVARRTAMGRSFDLALEAVVADLKEQLGKVPFRTRLEKMSGSEIILNAGRREGIQVGDVFLHKADGQVSRYRIAEAFQIGSRIEKISGPGSIQIGDTFVLDEGAEIPENRMAQGLSRSVAKLTAGSAAPETRRIIIDPPEFSNPDADASDALAQKSKSILPYELLRYKQYDQDILPNPTVSQPADLAAVARQDAALTAMQVAEAWEALAQRGLKPGFGVKIAVLDSGVDYNHKDLATRFDRTYAGFDFISHDLKPFDDNSHGTAVAGIIAARGERIVGVAPDAQLLAYKVFDPFGQTTSAALYGAAERALKDGAKILVLAWDTERQTTVLPAIAQLADQYGALLVAASGDKGLDIGARPAYPARLDGNVLRVAALGASGGLLAVSGRHSNYSAQYVDVAAPGENLLVASPRSETLRRSGSDMAAAYAAGVAALVWTAHPDWNAAQVRTQLVNGSQADPELANAVLEGRRLNAWGAVRD